MKTLILGLVCALAALPAAAQVGPGNQVPRDRVEKAQDRSQIRTDAARQQADVDQLNRLKSLQASYEGAARTHDSNAVAALDQQLIVALDTEIQESAREIQQQKAEVAQDTSENRSNRRETRSDIARGTPGRPGDNATDRARDVANTGKDVADTKAEAAALQKRQQIRAAYAPLAGRVDDPSLSQKSSMIRDVVAMANAEVQANAQEAREDHRELREDRREKREDIRQR